MLNDSYIVKIAKRKLQPINYAFMVITSIATLIFVLLFNIVPIIFGYNIIYFTGIISFFIVVGVVILIRNMSFEYEIEIVNDSFTINKIVAKRKRRFITDFSIKDCLAIGPCSSPKFNEAVKSSAFTLNCTEERNYDPSSSDNWFCRVKTEDVEYSIVFPFTDEMYPVFRRYNPRNTEFYKITNKAEED